MTISMAHPSYSTKLPERAMLIRQNYLFCTVFFLNDKMAKNKDLVNTFEVLMATSNKSESSKRTGMIKNGTLRKIAPKIYTTNMKDSPNEIIARNLFYILGHLYPHAVISHRSAFELRPTDTGDIFLTYSYSKKIRFPVLLFIYCKVLWERNMICHS